MSDDASFDKGTGPAEAPTAAATTAAADPLQFNSKTPPPQVPLALLPQFVELAKSDDPHRRLHGTIMLRKLLSVSGNPPIQEVVQSGAVPLLVRSLGADGNEQLQHEAAWAISNVASGSKEDTQYVVSLGAVPLVLRLLASDCDKLREQAAWAIGNIAGEGPPLRDRLLNEFNAMPVMLEALAKPANSVKTTRNIVWAISNLVRHKPLPPLDVVAIALPAMSALLNHDDDDVVIEALWALSYIAEGTPDRIQAVVNSGVIAKVVKFLSSPNWMFVLPAARIIGSLATGTSMQNQLVFSSGAVSHFVALMQNPRPTIRKEVVWCVGNLLVGDESQVRQVFSTDGLMKAVVSQLNDSNAAAVTRAVKQEALYALQNAINCCTLDQAVFLVDGLGLVRELADVVEQYSVENENNGQMLALALEVLHGIFSIEEAERAPTEASAPTNARKLKAREQFAQELQGMSLLEPLQDHANGEIVEFVSALMEQLNEIECAG